MRAFYILIFDVVFVYFEDPAQSYRSIQQNKYTMVQEAE